MLRILLVRDEGVSDVPGIDDVAGFFVERGHLVTAAESLSDIRFKCVRAKIQWVVCWRGREGGLVDTFLRSQLHGPGLDIQVLVVDTTPGGGRVTCREGERVIRLASSSSLHELATCMESRRLETAVSPTRSPESRPNIIRLAPGVEPLVGSCATILEIVEQVKRVAETDSTVLLLGESGTGKDLVAQSIHRRSPRSTRPLVTINCGAIPLELLESELFGYEQGAFTGARAARKGLLAQADGGTVFLDEVGELPLPLQVKLLRFLQEGEIAPLGSGDTVTVDVRVVSATNRDLHDLVDKRLFREDLYYRLAVIPVQLPPLRERKEDIPQLLHHFLSRCREKSTTPVEGFTREAIEALASYDWPGNVRELRNFVERLTVLSDTAIIELAHLPENIRRLAPRRSASDDDLPVDGMDFSRAVREYERAMIARALEKTSGNQKRAARLLGLGRTTLIAKAKKLGLL